MTSVLIAKGGHDRAWKKDLDLMGLTLNCGGIRRHQTSKGPKIQEISKAATFDVLTHYEKNVWERERMRRISA